MKKKYNKNILNPLLKYRGGKSRELNKYQQYIPEFHTYFEPFLGGGATYFYLSPKRAYISDINSSLIHFYKSFVQDYPNNLNELHELQRIYDNNRNIFEQRKIEYPNEHVDDPNDKLYYEIRDIFNGKRASSLSFSTVYFFINKLAYSGMIRYNNNGDFNVPYGRYKTFNTYLIKPDHYKLLSTARIMNESYETAFELAKSNDFIFLDPPYDTKFTDYGNEIFTGDFGEDEHRKLAEDFKNLSSPALMIISSTELINELYKDYIQGKYFKKYSVNIRNRFKSKAEHLIIANYEINSIKTRKNNESI